MKHYLLLLLSVFSFSLASQAKTLSGSWREVKRINHEGDIIRITDTIIINFLTGNEYTWQKRKDFIRRGTYKYEGDVIDMATKFYTVVKYTNKRLVLRDKEGIYEFEAFTPSRNQIPGDKAPSTVNSIEDIAGKWEVFKRTSSTTMKSIDYSTLMQKLIVEKREDSWGYITSSSNPHEKDAWKISRLENGVLYAEGKTNRQFEVSKRGGELIVKEGNITYFLKQFQE